MTLAPDTLPAADRILAMAAHENFPVAGVLFSREMRAHLLRIYGFARLADQLGDDARGDRTALLDWLGAEVDALFGVRGSRPRPEHPLLRRLLITVRAFDLPREPFDRLIEANRRDQRVARHPTFQDLLEYCALSANPVGELVLGVLGAATPERLALSDATCTGLQLVEFWQDLGEDLAMGRVYVPLEDLERFGYPLEDLVAGVRDDRFRALMRFESERARALLERGRPLAATLAGRAGLAVRLFTAGGLAALADLEARGFDTLDASASASPGRRIRTGVVELLRPARATGGTPAGPDASGRPRSPVAEARASVAEGALG
jgi:squalene synthase HpnC